MHLLDKMTTHSVIFKYFSVYIYLINVNLTLLIFIIIQLSHHRMQQK